MVLKKLISASVVGLVAIVSSGCEELNSNNMDEPLVSVRSDAQDNKDDGPLVSVRSDAQDNKDDGTIVLKKEKYPSFYLKDKGKLEKAGISPEEVSRFDDMFYKFRTITPTDLIIEFKQEGIKYETVHSYLESGFSNSDIILIEKGISFVRAIQYHKSLRLGISKFLEEDIDPAEANRFGELNEKYFASISAGDIVRYKENGISYEQVAAKAKEVWLERSVRE